MTTFEQAILYLLILIVLLLGFIAFCVWNHYRDVELNNFMSRKKLDNIDTNTATSVSADIETRDKVKNIDTILHNGFEEVGRPNGGCYINPQWKH